MRRTVLPLQSSSEMETLAALLPLNTLTVSLAGLSTMSKTLVKHYLQRKKVTEKT